MNLITRKLIVVELVLLDRIPDVVKIEETVKQLPNNKSSGMDGLIVEVLRKCWGWLQDDCVEVVQAFWGSAPSLSS